MKYLKKVEKHQAKFLSDDETEMPETSSSLSDTSAASPESSLSLPGGIIGSTPSGTGASHNNTILGLKNSNDSNTTIKVTSVGKTTTLQSMVGTLSLLMWTITSDLSNHATPTDITQTHFETTTTTISTEVCRHGNCDIVPVTTSFVLEVKISVSTPTDCMSCQPQQVRRVRCASGKCPNESQIQQESSGNVESKKDCGREICGTSTEKIFVATDCKEDTCSRNPHYAPVIASHGSTCIGEQCNKVTSESVNRNTAQASELKPSIPTKSTSNHVENQDSKFAKDISPSINPTSDLLQGRARKTRPLSWAFCLSMSMLVLFS